MEIYEGEWPEVTGIGRPRVVKQEVVDALIAGDIVKLTKEDHPNHTFSKMTGLYMSHIKTNYPQLNLKVQQRVAEDRTHVLLRAVQRTGGDA
jgi:hypothetical protein